MSVEYLRTQIEAYLNDKGYSKENSTRQNARSYIKLFLDFMRDTGHQEPTERVITGYLKKYAGTSNLGARENRVRDFLKCVKGEQQMSSPYENIDNEPIGQDTGVMPQESVNDTGNDTVEVLENESVNETHEGSISATNDKSVTDVQDISKAPKGKGRPKKVEGDKSKRKQISVYLNVETYEQLQDISYFTGLEIAKLSERAILKLIESNHEQLQKAQELKSRISLMNFEV